ncbi:hypothetical protein [Vibrio sp. 10N.261.51.F12]|uniref:hypothetical protein n=1 Tax=Vibrio sp. 10N.261.51.F12 TaxID=3229679 RepID=UPI003551AF79
MPRASIHDSNAKICQLIPFIAILAVVPNGVPYPLTILVSLPHSFLSSNQSVHCLPLFVTYPSKGCILSMSCSLSVPTALPKPSNSLPDDAHSLSPSCSVSLSCRQEIEYGII